VKISKCGNDVVVIVLSKMQAEGLRRETTGKSGNMGDLNYYLVRLDTNQRSASMHPSPDERLRKFAAQQLHRMYLEAKRVAQLYPQSVDAQNLVVRLDRWANPRDVPVESEAELLAFISEPPPRPAVTEAPVHL
jgi:hypothetical protein